jgi:hypothetical protein
MQNSVDDDAWWVGRLQKMSTRWRQMSVNFVSSLVPWLPSTFNDQHVVDSRQLLNWVYINLKALPHNTPVSMYFYGQCQCIFRNVFRSPHHYCQKYWQLLFVVSTLECLFFIQRFISLCSRYSRMVFIQRFWFWIGTNFYVSMIHIWARVCFVVFVCVFVCLFVCLFVVK